MESDQDNLNGYFNLEFDGETTENIKWDDYAVGGASVALSMARLSTVGELEVAREKSRRIVQGLHVNMSSGCNTATVLTGSTDELERGDLLWISNLPYYVVSTTSVEIVLGSNYSSATTIDEESIMDAKVYKWTYGYTWDATFTTQIGDLTQIIPSSCDNWAGTS
jgi:hypothetical protein